MPPTELVIQFCFDEETDEWIEDLDALNKLLRDQGVKIKCCECTLKPKQTYVR